MKIYIKSSYNPRQGEYNNYLVNHISAVQEAWQILKSRLIEDDKYTEYIHDCDDIISSHDDSKYTDDEYEAYCNYFYPSENNGKNSDEFNRAWLHHQHVNPHHWQHWVLINDDDGKPRALDMDIKYIFEMICDWASFQIMDSNKLVADWYKNNKSKIILSDKTRDIVEDLLPYFDEKEEDNE
jgi:hypothetical protein